MVKYSRRDFRILMLATEGIVMVMSVVVGREGRVCVTHDMNMTGQPIYMNFSPADRSMTVVFDDGTQARIASVSMPDFGLRLQKARSVLLRQLQANGPKKESEIPFHILMDGRQDNQPPM